MIKPCEPWLTCISLPIRIVTQISHRIFYPVAVAELTSFFYAAILLSIQLFVFGAATLLVGSLQITA